MKHIDIRNIMENGAYVGQSATVCGWVRTARDSKNMAFLALNDGTTLNHLQIVVDKAVLEMPVAATHLGSALKVVGTVVPAMNGEGVEINAESIEVLGDCPGDYRIFEHNNLNMVAEMKATLAPYVRRFFISHMARTLHTSHELLCSRMAPLDIEVAYDGLEIRLG